MEPEIIEHIRETHPSINIESSKVKTLKKAVAIGVPCVYIADMECRMPMCDMEVCQRCPKGHATCEHINVLKNLIAKVLLFILCFVIFMEI